MQGFLVVGLIKETADMAGHDRADILNQLQGFLIRPGNGLQGSEMGRQGLGRGLPHFPDAQRKKEAPEHRVTGTVDGRHQVARRLVAHTLKAGQLEFGQPVQIRHRTHHAFIYQHFDQPVAKTFNIHRLAGRIMADGFFALSRAIQAAGTACYRLTLNLDNVGTANRAMRRHFNRRCVSRAFFRHHLHHLRNNIACPANEHGIADVHIQTADFIHVMQGGVGNRDAADKHRFQACNRSNSASTAHLEFDVFNDRQLFLGRELVGNGPARCPGDKPELLLEIQAVHLEHDAVDFIGQAVTLFHQLVVGLQAGFRTLGLAHFRVDPETPVGHQLEAVPVGAGQHAFVCYCHAVGAELQRAFGGDGRFLLAQTAGGGITRVNKGLLVLLCQPLVQLLEPGFGHVHLATHLYQLRIAAAPKL